MAERKYGVLVHGAGWVSGQHIAAFSKNPRTQVVAISSRKRESCQKRAEEAGLKEVAFYTDYEKALGHEGVDIVSVCTPQQLHCENAVAAAQAGKHVLIEKPIANSVDEMRQMRAAVKKAGVKTLASFVLRWNPLVVTIKRMIAQGALGKVYFAEADYQHDIAGWWSGYEDARKKETGVSAMLVGGCHALDVVRFLLGAGEEEAAEPVEVFGYAGGHRKGKRETFNYLANRFEDQEPLEYDGLEVVLVRFAGGQLGKVSVNFDCVCPYTFPIEVFGDKGTIKDNRVWSHAYPGQSDWVTIPTTLPDSAEVAHHPFEAEIDYFVDCIVKDKKPHADLEDAIKTHEIAFAAQRCYETGQPVKLPLGVA